MAQNFDRYSRGNEALAHALTNAIPEPWDDVELKVVKYGPDLTTYTCTYQAGTGNRRKCLSIPDVLGSWVAEMDSLVRTPDKGFFRACLMTVTKDGRVNTTFAYGTSENNTEVPPFKSRDEYSRAIAKALTEVVNEPWNDIYVDFGMEEDGKIAYLIGMFMPSRGGEYKEIDEVPMMDEWSIGLLRLAGAEDGRNYRRYILDVGHDGNLDVTFYETPLSPDLLDRK